jgi:dipeptidyl aminopeptidase/acylaminoacyl peptidase
MPRWEQRIHAPQLLPTSLIGPAVSWATDVSNRGVLLATPTGRAEVFTFDASSTPASLRQVSDRPQGTTGAAISADGQYVLWFDDSDGDEVGRWVRETFSPDGSDAVVLLRDLPATFNAGVVAKASTTYLGRLTDDGLEIGVANASGDGSIVARVDQPGALVDIDGDEALALIAFAPDGDSLHMGIRVIRLADGAVVAELVDSGKALTPIGFSPTDGTAEATTVPAGTVLLTHERDDRQGILLWQPTTGQQDLLDLDLSGDLSAQWYPDGAQLLITRSDKARHFLHRYEFATEKLTDLPSPHGTIFAASARPDGAVHALGSSSATPPALIRLGDGPIVDLGEPKPPPSVKARDVFVDGPGGQVHSLVQEPEAGSAPYPTVFLVHGGPTWQDFDSFNLPAAAMLDAGYAVVRVNYRGSTGYGAAWRDALHTRLGFTELEDIAAIRGQLEAAGLVDEHRVAIAGGSWGGYVTLFAVGVEPDRWQCGAALVPLADWFVAHEDQPPFMTTYDNSLMGGTIAEIPDAYRAASPITYVDEVKAPLFVSAGANDPRCPPRQTDGYVERLRSRGHDVTYERWDVGHGLFDMTAKSRETRAILDFLTAKMPPEATSTTQ